LPGAVDSPLIRSAKSPQIVVAASAILFAVRRAQALDRHGERLTRQLDHRLLVAAECGPFSFHALPVPRMMSHAPLHRPPSPLPAAILPHSASARLPDVDRRPAWADVLQSRLSSRRKRGFPPPATFPNAALYDFDSRPFPEDAHKM